MKKILAYILPAICAFLLISCDKEQKLYEGPAQIAFENTAKTYTIAATTTSVEIPIQLIADGAQGAITANIAVNSTTNCASAVTVPASVTIDAGKFSSKLVINVNHSALAAGTNVNKLVLDLTASGIKVSQNYNKVTLTLNKQ